MHAQNVCRNAALIKNSSTGGSRYMRSFYLQICVCAIEKWPFFLEPILLFTVIVGLFICEFIIFEHIFGVPLAYNEVHL
jgi:hypothetical protein